MKKGNPIRVLPYPRLNQLILSFTFPIKGHSNYLPSGVCEWCEQSGEGGKGEGERGRGRGEGEGRFGSNKVNAHVLAGKSLRVPKAFSLFELDLLVARAKNKHQKYGGITTRNPEFAETKGREQRMGIISGIYYYRAFKKKQTRKGKGNNTANVHLFSTLNVPIGK